eukprot:2644295-Pyramimonas_sp.AAC.1
MMSCELQAVPRGGLNDLRAALLPSLAEQFGPLPLMKPGQILTAMGSDMLGSLLSQLPHLRMCEVATLSTRP